MKTIEIFDFSKSSKDKFLTFLEKYNNYKISDDYFYYDKQLRRLKSPKLYFSDKEGKKDEGNKLEDFNKGKWVIFNNKKEIHHLLTNLDYLNLRTIRNRNLITRQEQKVLYKKNILFIGMSVGSQVLQAFLRTGIGNEYTIIDADKVELHNINRTVFNLFDVGRKKIDVIEDSILSIDPYVTVNKVEDFLKTENILSYLQNKDLIIDAFDDFKVKIELRKFAKIMKIPVLSGFDVSRGAIVILERYDKESNLDISFYLNGYSPNEILKLKGGSLKKKTETFINIIGQKYHDKRMLESVLSVGTKLTGYPQLYIATVTNAALWTSVAIDLFLGKKLPSLRKYINMPSVYK